jgi:hypothetical protein
MTRPLLLAALLAAAAAAAAAAALAAAASPRPREATGATISKTVAHFGQTIGSLFKS